MQLPYWSRTKKKKQEQIIKFAGINYSESANEGEFSETYNISSREYPTISPRQQRQEVEGYNKPTALYVRDKLLVLDGNELKYDGRTVGTLKSSITKKLFATINSKVVIFPDKVYFDTETEEFVEMEARYPIYSGDATFGTATITVKDNRYLPTVVLPNRKTDYLNGTTPVTVYKSVDVGATDGKITFGESIEGTVSQLEPGHLLQLNTGENQWVKVISCYMEDNGYYVIYADVYEAILTEYPAFGEMFKEGDGVAISGCDGDMAGNNGTHIIRNIENRTLTFNANIFTAGTPTAEITIYRKVPDLVCICQSDNRLWGAEGHTIYASALGDPSNFFVYDNLSTDSYAVAVGTDGDFTGCIDYGSAVLFWKEDCVHKVLGSLPSQYQVNTYTVPGIQKGSEKSAVIINETLYYKGRMGVYAYGGGTPQLITEKFGSKRFYDATAGTDGTNYYISMKDERGVWELYVFDTERGIWLREEAIHVADFALAEGAVYIIDESNGKLMRFGKGDEVEGLIPWSAEFCEFDEHINGRKAYSKLYLRVESEAGAWFKVEVSRDGSPFRQVFMSHSNKTKIYQIPIFPAGCETFKVRVSGKGECRIKNMVREFSTSNVGYVK
jgi:hypothetical protein